MSSLLVYLASPFSSPDPDLERWRYESACEATGELHSRGVLAYSPIAHTYAIARVGGFATGFETWRPFDLAMIEACGEMAVLMLPGWDRSEGVLAELEHAQDIGRKVRHYTPAELGVDPLTMPKPAPPPMSLGDRGLVGGGL